MRRILMWVLAFGSVGVPVFAHLEIAERTFYNDNWIVFAGLGHVFQAQHECSMHNFAGENVSEHGPHLLLKVEKRRGIKAVLPRSWNQAYPRVWIGGGFREEGEPENTSRLSARFDMGDEGAFETITDPLDFNQMNVFVVPEENTLSLLSAFARSERLELKLDTRPEAQYDLDGFREAYGKLVQWCGAEGDGVLFQQLR
ncbi:MAG: hypothetical protein AAGA63_08830 [Pseudomonadota bacterium]